MAVGVCVSPQKKHNPGRARRQTISSKGWRTLYSASVYVRLWHVSLIISLPGRPLSSVLSLRIALLRLSLTWSPTISKLVAGWPVSKPAPTRGACVTIRHSLYVVLWCRNFDCRRSFIQRTVYAVCLNTDHSSKYILLLLQLLHAHVGFVLYCCI